MLESWRFLRIRVESIFFFFANLTTFFSVLDNRQDLLTMLYSYVLPCATEETGLLKPELVCNHDQMTLIIRKDFLEKEKLNSTSGHMNDPQCSQRLDHQEEVWYTLNRTGSTCGTTVKVRVVFVPCFRHLHNVS